MISGVKLTKIYKKMKTPEILKIFTKHGFNEYNCPFFKSEDIVNIANELEKAINYTHSCTELKDKEVLSFEEWLFVNNYKKLFDYFVKDSISFTESELMQIYNNKVMNL